MDYSVMTEFLSEDNIKKHLEYLRDLKLRLSILEKSLPQLKDKAIGDIARLPIDRLAKAEAVKLKNEILSHEVFFNSFTESNGKCEWIKKYYSSREAFLYELFVEAMATDGQFLYVYKDRHGSPAYSFSVDSPDVFIRYQPLLAMDLYEHTYFADYGFKKDKFLRSALERFDLRKLE